MKKLIILLITFYQKGISPFFPSACRFHPTCSHYGLESVQKHGVIKGTWYTVLRILKCNPFHSGGFDPVK